MFVLGSTQVSGEEVLWKSGLNKRILKKKKTSSIVTFMK